MARSVVLQIGPPRRRRRAAARSRVAAILVKIWPSVRTRRRLLHTYRKAPPAAKGFAVGLMLVVLVFAVNALYQVVRKPTELYFRSAERCRRRPSRPGAHTVHCFARTRPP